MFTTGMFTSHSGRLLSWKIDTTTLTHADWDALAAVAARFLPPFGYVHGVPKKGVPFAECLTKHHTRESGTLLIVDNVLTTGSSMEQARSEFLNNPWPTVIGLVGFARGPCPDWVTPVFTLHEGMCG